MKDEKPLVTARAVEKSFGSFGLAFA